MTKMSAAQYEILTEAFGRALHEVSKSDSDLLNATVLKVAGIVADELKYDNQNFDQRRFIKGIKATAKLGEIVQ